MEILRVGALALLALTATVVVRQWKPEWVAFVRIAAALVFLGLAMTMVSTVMSFVGDLGGDAMPEELWGILLKTLGIAFLTEVAAGICRDGGEGSLATWVEMAGKLEILILSLPLVEHILDAAKELLGL